MRRILIALLVSACATAATTVDAPALERPTTCHAWAGYDEAVDEYAATEGLGAKWAAAMGTWRERYCLAREVTDWYRARGEVVVGVRYWPGAAGWADEDAHLALLDELLALVYPALEWRLGWGVGGDVVLWLGAPENRGRLDRVLVMAGHESIVAHEMGHALGLTHHYDDDADAGAGLHQPLAGEACRMDLTGSELDSACRFATGAPWGEPEPERVVEIGAELNAGG